MDALLEYRSQLLHEHVADKLREMIITGELSPGAATLAKINASLR